jgi:hypothetical protein
MRGRGGCWRWEKGLTSGPKLSGGRCWAAAANGPEEGTGPCGEHGPHAGEAGGELGCGLEERRGERGLGRFCFFKKTFVLNLFKLLKLLNSFQIIQNFPKQFKNF